MTPPNNLRLSTSQILATNLTAALTVAGPMTADGRPGRLQASQIQRETKIARSTLRALKTSSEKYEPNPDLRTLVRLAKELHVPAFLLLMGPNDWLWLLRALEDLGQTIAAADSILGDPESEVKGPEAALQVLRALKVYPETPPAISYGQTDPELKTTLDKRNESRRKSTLVTAALALTAVRSDKSYKLLTALAASLANQMTLTQ